MPLVVTAGEPAGIGPDLCIALAADAELPSFVVIGDAEQLASRAALLNQRIRIDAYQPGTLPTPGTLTVLDLPFPLSVTPGVANAENATVLLDGLRRAVDGCVQGEFSGLVTAPLAKHVVAASGTPFSGHTEFLAELTNTPLPVMLLVAGDMRVALATTHLPSKRLRLVLLPSSATSGMSMACADRGRTNSSNSIDNRDFISR